MEKIELFEVWCIVRRNPETGNISLSLEETADTLSGIKKLAVEAATDKAVRIFQSHYSPIIKAARIRIEIVEEAEL